MEARAHSVFRFEFAEQRALKGILGAVELFKGEEQML